MAAGRKEGWTAPAALTWGLLCRRAPLRCERLHDRRVGSVRPGILCERLGDDERLVGELLDFLGEVGEVVGLAEGGLGEI